MGFKTNGEYNTGYVADTNPGNELALSNGPTPNAVAKTQIYDRRKDKFLILKNVVIISFAFLLNFTAFNSMANLQSSINKSLGTTSLWTIYASIVLSCAFVPSWLIKKLKVKWTVAVSMLCYSTYIAAQFYPRYYTLVPTAFLLGLGAAPMWSAKCTYLTEVGTLYANIVGEKSDVIITRFFGIFFMFFQSSQIWGNLISSTILSEGVVEVTKSEDDLLTCGANFCPVTEETVSEPLSVNASIAAATEDAAERQKIIIMSSIYLACSLLSVVIIILLVDPLSRFKAEETLSSSKTGKALVMASFTHMCKINQIFLIPLTMWSGFEQAFLGADFTAAFVTCGLGVHMVGYILICYGICDAVCSMGLSSIEKRTGRIPIFSFAALLNIVLLFVMLFWKPNPDQIYVFFIIAACWGISDAVWQTQINALYGAIFPGESEAAFSNYRLWESIGFIFAYVWSGTICVNFKIYILFGVLIVSMMGYFIVEIIQAKGGLKYNGKYINTLKDLQDVITL